MREIGRSSSQHVDCLTSIHFPIKSKRLFRFRRSEHQEAKENTRLNSALATEGVEVTRANGSRRVDDSGWQNPAGIMFVRVDSFQ